MERFLVGASVLVVAVTLGLVRESTLKNRVASLEQTGRGASEHGEELDRRVAQLTAELELLQAAVAEGEASEEVGAELARRLASVVQALDDAIEMLTLQDERIVNVRDRITALQASAASEDRIVALEQGFERRYSGLSRAIEATGELVAETRARVTTVAQNSEARWERTLGPTVQLSGDTTVGSGVLLESQPQGDGTYRTLVLTCWHVVRDIQGDGRGEGAPIPVQVYHQDGSVESLHGTVLGANVELDACLLRLETERKMPFGAWLPGRARLGAARVCDPVVAVGCPLGNDPIPTFGNLSDLRHRVDGNRFWMISAPTFIGNSGGAVFDANEHVVLGVFSKIYTHGSIRPVIVPHMGLVTPLEEIYTWLESSRIARVVEGTDGRVTLTVAPDDRIASGE